MKNRLMALWTAAMICLGAEAGWQVSDKGFTQLGNSTSRELFKWINGVVNNIVYKGLNFRITTNSSSWRTISDVSSFSNVDSVKVELDSMSYQKALKYYGSKEVVDSILNDMWDAIKKWLNSYVNDSEFWYIDSNDVLYWDKKLREVFHSTVDDEFVNNIEKQDFNDSLKVGIVGSLSVLLLWLLGFLINNFNTTKNIKNINRKESLLANTNSIISAIRLIRDKMNNNLTRDELVWASDFLLVLVNNLCNELHWTDSKSIYKVFDYSELWKDLTLFDLINRIKFFLGDDNHDNKNIKNVNNEVVNLIHVLFDEIEKLNDEALNEFSFTLLDTSLWSLSLLKHPDD